MRILLIFIIVLCIACSKSAEDLPAGLKYFPEMGLLEKGVVFKYYYHTGEKGSQPKTDIRFKKMRLKGKNIIYESYDAEFLKTYHSELEIVGNQWIVKEDKTYNYRNDFVEMFKEYTYTFKEKVSIDWSQNEAKLDKTLIYDGNESRRIFEQKEIMDTIVDGRDTKIFHGQRSYYSIIDNEENEPSEYSTVNYYEEGLGMTKWVMSDDEFIYEMVLDEIMSLEEFERRANHAMQRVGYIDTSQTIDDHTLFQPCFHPSKINDYYNGERAGFKGGKGRLRALLKEKLDPSKLENESGYLTFRFVVNCKGEAGWFVTEEAGLNYEKKQFSETSRMHLYEILKKEKEWTNLRVRQEPRDAYTYITFKIKNGEIIELLP